MTEEELENITDNLYELQRKRLLDIEKRQIENLDILDIKYLGKIQVQTEEGQILQKEVYVSIEQKDGKIAYKYYDENQELLGIEQENNYIGKPNEKEKIKNLNEKEISLNIMKEKQQNEKENKEEISKQKSEKIEVPLDQQITSKVSKKEEVDLDEIQNGETLRNLLGLGGEYTKIVLVNSNQVNAFLPASQRRNNIDSFIAVKENGESTVLGDDILEYDARSGINPQDENTTINIDGKVEKEKSTSRYKIKNGNGNQYLSVGYDESVGREIKFSEWSNQYGTYVDTELQTSRVLEEEVNKDVRKEQKRKPGTDDVNEKEEKYEKEEKNGCEETDITKVDDNKYNESHIHEDEVINAEMEEKVEKIMKNDVISINYTKEEVVEYFLKKINEKKMTIDEIAKYVEEDLERTAPIKYRSIDKN